MPTSQPRFSMKLNIRRLSNMPLILLLTSLFFESCADTVQKTKSSKVQKTDSTVLTNKALSDSSITKKGNIMSVSDSMVYLYLTFDDGPNNGTPKLLKLLNEFKIQSSLFIVGKNVAGSKFQKTMFQNYGNYSWLELCNHSYTHANHKYKAFYANPSAVVADFLQCHDSLRFNNRISRAPGANMWSINGDSSRFRTKTAAAQKLQEAGFQMVGWDVDWDFKNVSDHRHMLQRLVEIENSRYPKRYPAYHLGHIVILMHDQSFTDPAKCEELRKFLLEVQAKPQKYQFRKISEYPLLQKSAVLN